MENIIHKFLRKDDEKEDRKARCGLSDNYTDEETETYEWSKVTCKSCLRLESRQKKELEIVKIGDKVIIPSREYIAFDKTHRGYKAYGIIVSFNPELKKYLIRFTEPLDEKDFEKYFKREKFRLDKPMKAKHTKPLKTPEKAVSVA